jgi:hypothetical protein
MVSTTLAPSGSEASLMPSVPPATTDASSAPAESLAVLRQRLMASTSLDGSGFSVDPRRIRLLVTYPGSALYRDAADIVNYAYNSRFVEGTTAVIDIARDDGHSGHRAKVMAAIQDVGGRAPPLVLGTVKIDFGTRLDFMDLFHNADGGRWPHQLPPSPVNVAAELGRLAFHPALDDAESAIKQLIWRRMYAAAIDELRITPVRHIYFVVSPHVRKFLVAAGVVPTPVEGAVLSRSSLVTALQQQFPRYWRPGHDRAVQPALYAGPWKLSPWSGD